MQWKKMTRIPREGNAKHRDRQNGARRGKKDMQEAAEK
jgi:hypothetical protein